MRVARSRPGSGTGDDPGSPRRVDQGAAQGLEQLRQAHLDLALVLRAGLRLGGRRAEDVAPEQGALAQLAGRLLEALVLEQPRHELGARVGALPFLLLRVGREERT